MGQKRDHAQIVGGTPKPKGSGGERPEHGSGQVVAAEHRLRGRGDRWWRRASLVRLSGRRLVSGSQGIRKLATKWFWP